MLKFGGKVQQFGVKLFNLAFSGIQIDILNAKVR